MNQGSSAYEAMRNTLGDSVWTPFQSQHDWEVARWAKMRGPSSSAVTELLAIPEVVERHGLSYSATNELNSIVDKLPGRALANLFHSCMDKLLSPIHSYGENGLVMTSGDGTWRQCHPIFAAFIGDYPEQALVTCTYNGRCPKCTVPRDQLGEFLRFPARDLTKAFDTFLLADENTSSFHSACNEAGLKPIYHPFWQHLPLTNIYILITPDVLHQLLQGVLKHLLSWLTRSVVFGAMEIDARCRCLPPNHHITLFPKGITGLSRILGKEHKAMCRILIGLIVDIPLPGGQAPSRVVRATRALLVFIYVAQFPSHTTQTLKCLEDSLATFHQNKDVFVDVGVREHFNIPKLHSLLHYGYSIGLFGTTENYNTEQTALAHRFHQGRMTAWVERCEKVKAHITYAEWRQRFRTSAPEPTPVVHLQSRRFLKMAQHPTVKAVSFEELSEKYGAVDFQDCLADFIAQLNHPGASAAVLRTRAADTLLPFQTVPVFHRIKFTSSGSTGNSEIVDSVVVRPEQNDAHGRTIPSRFDTVLVHGRHEDVMHGNHGNRIAQVRVVFRLPDKVIPNLFPSSDTTIPSYLAYVEWFSPLSATPDNNNLMYKRASSPPPHWISWSP
ncbi:hypothetical protein EDB87DRAFT_1577735 [Lactarius vividus]|nr:hypothetical protein EDB87DRAFT_1577735 [Lactarius vividus]